MSLIHSELNTLQLYFQKYSFHIRRKIWRHRRTANENSFTFFGGIISVDCCFIHAFPLLEGIRQEGGRKSLANGISIKTSRKRRTVPGVTRVNVLGQFSVQIWAGRRAVPPQTRKTRLSYALPCEFRNEFIKPEIELLGLIY